MVKKLKIHFENGEILKINGTMQMLTKLYLQFNEKPSENQFICADGKYLFDITKINYIEEVEEIDKERDLSKD